MWVDIGVVVGGEEEKEFEEEGETESQAEGVDGLFVIEQARARPW